MDEWLRSLGPKIRLYVEHALGRRPVLLARVWEKQRRGVLHVHPVLGYSTPAERAAADLYFRELARLASAHGFGYLERKRRVMRAKASAAYLSSYFVKGKGRKRSLTESVKDADMPRSIVYVAPWLSQKSGWTMRSLRLKRFLWVHSKGRTLGRQFSRSNVNVHGNVGVDLHIHQYGAVHDAAQGVVLGPDHCLRQLQSGVDDLPLLGQAPTTQGHGLFNRFDELTQRLDRGLLAGPG